MKVEFTEIYFCNVVTRDYPYTKEIYIKVLMGKRQKVCDLPLKDLERKKYNVIVFSPSVFWESTQMIKELE